MTYKNRGMLLEAIINATLTHCAQTHVALLHKKDLAVRIHEPLGKAGGFAASLKGVSTVDYYGVCRGRFVAFEAKATRRPAWPLSALQPHQNAYLQAVAAHGGLAFVLLGYITTPRFFVLPIAALSTVATKQISANAAAALGTELTLVFPGRLNLCEVLDEQLAP